MMIEIEKNIPMPAGNYRNKYPWGDLAVGDSFEFPDGVSSNAAHTAASLASLRFQKTFRVRKTGDNTFRCWRLA